MARQRRQHRKTQFNIQATGLSDDAYNLINDLAEKRLLSKYFKNWAESLVNPNNASLIKPLPPSPSPTPKQDNKLEQEVKDLKQQINQLTTLVANLNKQQLTNMDQQQPKQALNTQYIEGVTIERDYSNTRISMIDEDTDYNY